jgi:26S proteasome regulatory subunit N13
LSIYTTASGKKKGKEANIHVLLDRHDLNKDWRFQWVLACSLFVLKLTFSISAGSGPTDAATVVQNFLNSLKGGNAMLPQSGQGGQIYTTLPDLLPTSVTIPIVDSATPQQIDNLLSYLPPTILLIAQEAASIDGMVEPNSEVASTAMQALSLDQKKAILRRVLRSPQFHQSLGSLTMAIRDGGLPSIADALGVQLQNGGLVRGGSMPLGGGDAVEAFIQGVKKTVEEKK